MSKQHGPKQQKKLAKKKAKIRDKHKKLAQQTSLNPMIRLAYAENWPIHEALIPVEIWEAGIGHLILTRHIPGGGLAMAVFMVDVYCLGIKRAFWQIVTHGEYEKLKQRSQPDLGPTRKVAPEYLCKLVYDAAEYAASLGFLPHSEFRHAKLLLAGLDPALCSEQFTFGHEGKPLYVRGPNETIEQAHRISMTVQQHGGHFVVSGGPEVLRTLADFDPANDDFVDQVYFEDEDDADEWDDPGNCDDLPETDETDPRG